MDEQLVALYHRHVAAAFDRQLRFNDFLDRKAGGEDWEYDTETATLAFGKLKFEALFVGSHAFHNNSWLWAWSNKHLKLTVTNRALGDTVRVLVHRLGLHALAAAGFSLEPLLGPELTDDAAHVLGMILSRELGYNGYYLTPYDGGTGLTIIRDKRLDFTERRPLVRIITVFPQVIDALTVFDHKAALTSYASDYGVIVVEEPGRVKLAQGKDELIASFDDLNRLTGIEGTVTAEVLKPAKKMTKPPTTRRPKKVAKRAAAKSPANKPPAKTKPVAKKSAKPAKAAKRR
jgi:hypothetical protein